MRNHSDFTISGLESAISKRLAESLKRVKSLMDDVVINTTLQECNYNLRSFRSQEVFELIVLLWYLPKEIQWTLRLDLEERVERMEFSDKHKEACFFCLKGKTQTLLFLQETNLWSTEEFFGSYLQKDSTVLRRLCLLKRSRKVVIPQRKRGYNDQGSRAEDPSWKSARAFWLDTQQMMEMEKERDEFQFTLDFLEGLVC